MGYPRRRRALRLWVRYSLGLRPSLSGSKVSGKAVIAGIRPNHQLTPLLVEEGVTLTAAILAVGSTWDLDAANGAPSLAAVNHDVSRDAAIVGEKVVVGGVATVSRLVNAVALNRDWERNALDRVSALYIGSISRMRLEACC